MCVGLLGLGGWMPSAECHSNFKCAKQRMCQMSKNKTGILHRDRHQTDARYNSRLCVYKTQNKHKHSFCINDKTTWLVPLYRSHWLRNPFINHFVWKHTAFVTMIRHREEDRAVSRQKSTHNFPVTPTITTCFTLSFRDFFCDHTGLKNRAITQWFTSVHEMWNCCECVFINIKLQYAQEMM